MRLRIHRGTKEIGGTCIEVEARGERLALDVGLPLDAPDDEGTHASLLPAVPGFRERDDSLLGVLISHPHRDHYGLARHIRPEVPIHIGRDAHNILEAASRYVPNGHAFADPRFIAHRAPVEIGPFRVTPYLVDHSAFDAYALLIEADGKRVFYSGDFRGHGRKAGLFEALVANPPEDIDVLLMEGTTIGRAGTDEGFATEDDLERAFAQAFRETKGLHFVWTSSQNIDRLVTIFRAAKRTGRALLIDLYTAVVLEATGRDTIPQSDWADVRLYVPHRQRVYVKRKGLFDDLGRHKANRVFPGGAAGSRRAGRHAVPADGDARPRRPGGAGRSRAHLFDVGGLSGAGGFAQGPGMAGGARHPLAHHPHLRPRLGGRPETPRRRTRAACARADTLLRDGPVRGALRERRPAGRWRVVGSVNPAEGAVTDEHVQSRSG